MQPVSLFLKLWMLLCMKLETGKILDTLADTSCRLCSWPLGFVRLVLPVVRTWESTVSERTSGKVGTELSSLLLSLWRRWHSSDLWIWTEFLLWLDSQRKNFGRSSPPQRYSSHIYISLWNLIRNSMWNIWFLKWLFKQFSNPLQKRHVLFIPALSHFPCICLLNIDSRLSYIINRLFFSSLVCFAPFRM